MAPLCVDAHSLIVAEIIHRARIRKVQRRPQLCARRHSRSDGKNKRRKDAKMRMEERGAAADNTSHPTVVGADGRVAFNVRAKGGQVREGALPQRVALAVKLDAEPKSREIERR